jgi:hypothetical protein
LRPGTPLAGISGNIHDTQMKKIVFCFFLLSALIAGAQNVGVNSTGNPPNSSAMLDVDATNKGMLIPRVSLLSTTDVVTIPSPATSLLVYNSNAGMTGGGVGFYWWNGVMWVALNQAFNQTYSAYSTGGVTTNATWQTIPGMTMTFTVPAGMTGKFIIYADVGILTTSAVNPSGTDVSININGTWTAGSGGYKRVYLRPGAINTENNVFGNAVMKQVKTLSPGVYTIDVRAWQQLTGAGTSTSTVGGASGSVLQGTLIVEMILQ